MMYGMKLLVWDEITYPFLNFNGATVEVWEWISNLIPYVTVRMIIYPCWDWSSSMLLKGAPDVLELDGAR